MNSERIEELSISLSNIKDLIASFLYQVGKVHDNEDVLDISFVDLEGRDEDWQLHHLNGSVPLKVKIKKRSKEVKVVDYNNGKG